MLAVVQRVSSASVSVGGEPVSSIGPGLLVLLGVASGDGETDARYVARKLAGLRIFADAQGLMNLSVSQARGEVLVVSQFTLLGDTRRGNRPSFARAAPPQEAERLYLDVCERLRRDGLTVATGSFGAMMEIRLTNDGPVTVIIDTATRAGIEKAAARSGNK